MYNKLIQPQKRAKIKSCKPVEKVAAPQELQATVEEPVVTLGFDGFKAKFNLPSDTHLFAPTKGIEEENPKILANRKKKVLGTSRQSTILFIEKLVKGGSKRRTTTLWPTRKYANKLNRLLRCFRQEYDKWQELLVRKSEKSTEIFNCIKEFDIFVRLLFACLKEKMETVTATGSGPTAKRAKVDDDSGDSVPVIIAPKKGTELNRKFLRAQRMYDNNRLLLQPEPLSVIKERDSMFAWNYMNKVKETFLGEKKPEKLNEFLRILKNVKPTDSVPVLYQVNIQTK